MKFPELCLLDEMAMQQARERENNLTKPLGSLGSLEDYAIRLAGIRGSLGGSLKRRLVLVFAADNGVHAQGITPVPKAVTASQTKSIADGKAGVSVLAKQAGAQVAVYNVGVEQPLCGENIVNCVVMHGTGNIAEEPAMTKEQCEQAMQVGFDAVVQHKQSDVIGIGEMGICNTTTTAAVGSVLLGLPPEEMTGRGAGITDEQYAKKVQAVQDAILCNKPDARDVVDVIAKVGGLDIAAMTGAYLGCAHYRIPVVVDGFISALAALCAVRMNSRAVQYMFASHKSCEKGYMPLIEELGLSPALDLGMRLGEGSGCPLMFQILEASLRILDEMGTFEDCKIDASEFVDLREE